MVFVQLIHRPMRTKNQLHKHCLTPGFLIPLEVSHLCRDLTTSLNNTPEEARGRGDQDVRTVQDGWLHALLLLVDAARGEAPLVVGNRVGNVGEDGLDGVVHLDALLPVGADDDGQGRLGLGRVVVHGQEAVDQGEDEADRLAAVLAGDGHE